MLDNTAAALTFNDPERATETLEMLAIHPHIRLACLYCRRGALFASNSHGPDSDTCPPSSTPASDSPPNRSTVTEQLTRGRRPRSDPAGRQRPRRASRRGSHPDHGGRRDPGRRPAALVPAVVTLQRIVAAPDRRAGRTPRAEIADRGDYSIRATHPTRDEIGVLVQAFNRMLDEIERRSASAPSCSSASSRPTA